MTAIIFASVCASFATQITRQDVDNAFEVMSSYYNHETGFWGKDKHGWWHESSILESTLNYCDVTGNTYKCLAIAENTYRKGELTFTYHLKEAGFDDIGWSGLAWVKAWQISGGINSGYLKRSKKVFDEMAKAWDDHCNGGLWWDRKRSYKNAITNEIFLTLAMRLYTATNSSDYLNWGLKTWEWLSTSAMISDNHLIQDGLTMNCSSKGNYYTYNQGVLLDGLAILNFYKKNETIENFALNIIKGVRSEMTNPEGVLVEKAYSGSGNPGPDSCQFKGILTRSIGYFFTTHYQGPDSVFNSSLDFIVRNANSIIKKDTDSYGRYGYFYQGPPQYVDYITHSSGFDTIVAAYGFQNKNLSR